MFDVIGKLLANAELLVLAAFVVAIGAMMLFAYMKTRSTPAVLGVAILGIMALVLVSNMTIFADLFGQDVLGQEQTKVSQLVGGATPPTTLPDGGSTATTVTCTQPQREAKLC